MRNNSSFYLKRCREGKRKPKGGGTGAWCVWSRCHPPESECRKGAALFYLGKTSRSELNKCVNEIEAIPRRTDATFAARQLPAT
jgi:hypothetical protein